MGKGENSVTQHSLFFPQYFLSPHAVSETVSTTSLQCMCMHACLVCACLRQCHRFISTGLFCLIERICLSRGPLSVREMLQEGQKDLI